VTRAADRQRAEVGQVQVDHPVLVFGGALSRQVLRQSPHPLAAAGPAMTLDDYLDCAHLLVEVVDGDQSVIDGYLQGLGTPRTASVTVPYHAAAADLVPGTSLVATIPARLAAHHTGEPGIAVIPAPAEVQDMSYQMVWHPRLDGDPAQRWLRDAVRAVTAAFRP
jgi:DNA-binding transcriptional LysR family regulator